MFLNALRRINHWIKAIGPWLAIIAIALALWFAHTDASRAHDLALSQSQSTCQRQIDANADAVLLIDTLEADFHIVRPDGSYPPAWDKFRHDWLKHHSDTPACALARKG